MELVLSVFLPGHYFPGRLRFAWLLVHPVHPACTGNETTINNPRATKNDGSTGPRCLNPRCIPRMIGGMQSPSYAVVTSSRACATFSGRLILPAAWTLSRYRRGTFDSNETGSFVGVFEPFNGQGCVSHSRLEPAQLADCPHCYFVPSALSTTQRFTAAVAEMFFSKPRTLLRWHAEPI